LIVYKHHIASDFIKDPSLCSNNGGGKGGTVFFEYDYMIEFLRVHCGNIKWYYCVLDVEPFDIIKINENIAQLKKDVPSIIDFKPLNLYA